jgi:hypothetical protein
VLNGYGHLGLGGDMCILRSSDISELLNPFDPSVGFGYSYFARVGFRNVVQLEYRGGRDKNDLLHREMGWDFEYHTFEISMSSRYTEFVIKLNPVFYAYESKTLAIFFIWGKGDTEYVDDNGDGFWDGNETIYGFEVSRLLRNASVGASLEIHDVTFDRFAIKDLGCFVGNFDARYIRIGINVAGGLGF